MPRSTSRIFAVWRALKADLTDATWPPHPTTKAKPLVSFCRRISDADTILVPGRSRGGSRVCGRTQITKARAGVPDRATSMQMGDGTSVTLATPGVGNWHTGIPTVDEVLRRRDRRPVGYST